MGFRGVRGRGRHRRTGTTFTLGVNAIKTAPAFSGPIYLEAMYDIITQYIYMPLNPFTTGNPFLGTKLLGYSMGRGSGALVYIFGISSNYGTKAGSPAPI